MPIGSRVKLERVKENHKPTKDKPWDSEQDIDKNSWINPMRWDDVYAISPSFHLSLKTKLWDLKNYIENIWKSCLKSASQFLLFSEEIWTSQTALWYKTSDVPHPILSTPNYLIYTVNTH